MQISLVIPAYNEERHLQACLQSVARQTIMPLEVIVVDNNCTDGTVRVACSFPFVRVVRESRQGIVFARNTGFDAACGDIIARIDADTLLPSNWIEYLQHFYADPAHQKNAWTGRGYFYNVRLPRLVGLVYELLAFDFNKLLFNGTYTLWGSNMALTVEQWRSVAQHVCLRTDIHEDLDLAIHLHQAGYRVVYDRKLVTMTRLRRFSSRRSELWPYLQWWPRTLRVHGNWRWPFCWFFGALLPYIGSYGLVVAERLARLFGKKPLADNHVPTEFDV